MEYFFNNKNIINIHFVGIGGISMSALAKLCLSLGYKVSGSDRMESNITFELSSLGAKIFYTHNEKNVENADLVVYTIAVSEENIEVKEARKRKIPLLERADFLKEIGSMYKNVIAISGTHGKTTTTAMIGSIFLCANKNPTIHLGGLCDLFYGNLKIGGYDYFITEACEYKKHLLKISHDVGVILNVEADHPDSYADMNDLYQTFATFCKNSKKISVINENYVGVLGVNSHKVITFGNNISANFTTKNIIMEKDSKLTYDCYKNEEFYTKIRLNVYGLHNILNLLGAIAVADYYNISEEDITCEIEKFCGVHRRFEFMGKINGNIVIQDYAHHPTEIKETIKTAKEIFKKKIVVVFQPHTYTRTKSLFSEFLTCFDETEKLYLLPTYSARENLIRKSSSKYLYQKIKLIKQNCKYFYSFNSVYRQLKEEKDCVILIIGAGDIEILAQKVKKDYLLPINKKKYLD